MAYFDILPDEHINVLAWALVRRGGRHDDLEAGEWLADRNRRPSSSDMHGNVPEYHWALPRHEDWSERDLAAAANEYVQNTFIGWSELWDNRFSDLAHMVTDMAREAPYGETLVIRADSTPSRTARDWFLQDLFGNFQEQIQRLGSDVYVDKNLDRIGNLRHAAKEFIWALDQEPDIEPVADASRPDRIADLVLEAYGLGPYVENATSVERSHLAALLDGPIGHVDPRNAVTELEQHAKEWMRIHVPDTAWWNTTDRTIDRLSDERMYGRLNKAIYAWRLGYDRERKIPGYERPSYDLPERVQFKEHADLAGKVAHAYQPELDADRISVLIQDAFDPAGPNSPAGYPPEEVDWVRYLIVEHLRPEAIQSKSISKDVEQAFTSWWDGAAAMIGEWEYEPQDPEPDEDGDPSYDWTYDEDDDMDDDLEPYPSDSMPVDTANLDKLVETWGETMDDVMVSDHPTRIADRILETNGLDPVEQPDLETQVADYITPTFDRLDGNLPAGSRTFARLAIESHLEGADTSGPVQSPVVGTPAYPDPVNADPYASPADQAPDPTATTSPTVDPSPARPAPTL
ncbi:hypothetical protein CSQ85_08925 [Bifidobacterium rousetti]|uniref:hypothetical protein n=1 Tax=Bifidobacterium rousetti TaxID=2045439 RepID=UPI00123B5D12|nr:hypothetical protein [Bifidobacterium rousetti]KAA8818273.1 hypothetical protein CSQ85_08925 [Bifidobacterium rousetti]